MPAIDERHLISQALSPTASTMFTTTTTIEDASISGESREKVPNDFLIDGDDNSSSEEFSSLSADKVILDEDDDGWTFRLPKYFQALLTLFLCFSLLLITLTIIRQTRKLCRKSPCAKTIPMIRVDSDKDKGGLRPTVVSDNADECGRTAPPPSPSNSDRKHYEHYHSVSATHPQPNDKENEKDLLKLKKVRFERRVSGPFGDEALDFVGQTYKKKCKEKVQAEHLGKVQGHIRTQQSVRKQSKALTHPPLPPTVAPPPPQ